MLNAESSLLAHRIQDLILIGLSLIFFPLNTFILWISYRICHRKEKRYLQQRAVARSGTTDFQAKTILVTGVGMTKGLALARLFYLAGHDVIGADFEPGHSLVCGQVSRAVKKFYRLQPPSADRGNAAYLEGLLDVITKENVDLWVSCSGVASAVDDGVAKQVVEARTSCLAIQFDAKTTQMLHEKHTFIDRVRELGLNVPETYEVSSRAKVEDVFRSAPKGRKYIMKTIGVDDSVRADMTLLPKASQKETSQHIARLKISEATPWIVQQFIDGVEFCTHSLVVRGEVKAFVACPSAELLMHYEALPTDSPLSKAMLQFTTTFAENSGDEFTGHLSFDFLVETSALVEEDPSKIDLYPIECNPRAHTAVALFNDTPELAEAYISALATTSQVKPSYAEVVDPDPTRTIVTPRTTDAKYYWIGHDLVTNLLLPLVDLLLLRTSIVEVLQHLDVLLDHVFTWRDGTYVVWDPLPCWWLYHVYWPVRFWDMFVRGRGWSRINVSTGKMFEC